MARPCNQPHPDSIQEPTCAEQVAQYDRIIAMRKAEIRAAKGEIVPADERAAVRELMERGFPDEDRKFRRRGKRRRIRK